MIEPMMIFYMVNGLLGALCAVLWWNFITLKSLIDDCNKARLLDVADLQAYKLHASETYITQTDLSKAIENFGKAMEAVFKKLERIEDKLDLKADK